MSERHQLGNLIETVQKQNGWSDRDLQDRADRLGLEMSKSNFSRIKNNEVKSVRGSFIRELSRVLGVPQRVVSDAALASMGVEVGRSAVQAEDAIARDITIAGHDRRLAIALIDAMRQEASGQDDRQGEEEPGTEARSEEHSSTGGSKDGSATGQSGAAIGEVHQLHPDQGQLQPPPDAEKSAAWRTENRGKKIRREQDEHAEE